MAAREPRAYVTTTRTAHTRVQVWADIRDGLALVRVGDGVTLSMDAAEFARFVARCGAVLDELRRDSAQTRGAA